MVINAIPSGILQLLKGQFRRQETEKVDFTLLISGINIMSHHCNNKHIRNHFFKKRKITPRGKFLWTFYFSDINWKITWLLPYKFAISNKIKEIQYKIIHNIYPTNLYISRFVKNIDVKCVFCNAEEETLKHLFFECQFSQIFWKKIENYIFIQSNIPINLEAKDVLLYYKNKERKIQHLTNLIILMAKFHIHKAKFSKARPFFPVFETEFKNYIECIKMIDNKKCLHTINLIEETFREM